MQILPTLYIEICRNKECQYKQFSLYNHILKEAHMLWLNYRKKRERRDQKKTEGEMKTETEEGIKMIDRKSIEIGTERKGLEMIVMGGTDLIKIGTGIERRKEKKGGGKKKKDKKRRKDLKSESLFL